MFVSMSSAETDTYTCVYFNCKILVLDRMVNGMGVPFLRGSRSEYSNGDNHLVFGVAIIAGIYIDITPGRTGSYSNR